MESKLLSELNGNPKNPRRISKHDFDALLESIRKFGNLSDIVFNETTGRLVGGHQRVQAFKALGGEHKIVFEPRYDAPNRQGTVALGRFEHEGEMFNCRLVVWDEPTEIAANIAANRVQGEWDLDLLAQANQFVLENGSEELLLQSGQTINEINDLGKMTGSVEPDPSEAPNEPPMIIRVECDSDQQMTELFSELQARGLRVKVI